MTNTIGQDQHDTRIDSRILRHLLHEASDLLEEAQTHALVEKQCHTTACVLSQTNWRMTATCIWAIGELFPGQSENDRGAQLHAPIPIFSRSDQPLSPQMTAFVQRVDRLHERAQRLDSLSRGPMVSSEMQAHDAMPEHESDTDTKDSATIIPLFGSGYRNDDAPNTITLTQSKVRWAMAGPE